ncbi:MAG TPA: hypothetical protein VEB40_15550 [Flavipsychrobacter sp.]|nr:hypothetical protein [Flavipsychrobacter sp.]
MYEFAETQRFRQRWVWLVLGVAATVPCVSILVSDNWSERTSAIIDLAVAIGIPPLIIGFLTQIKLSTRVDSSGVSFRFFPIQLKETTIFWDEIEKVDVRTYKPIREFGGWGWRHSFKNGRAFNVSGNWGLQLVLKTGKKVLVGTQKADELRSVLAGLGKL